MFVAFIQARSTSKRYPKKMVKAKIGDRLLLEHIVDRLNSTSSIDKVYLITPLGDEEMRSVYKKLFYLTDGILEGNELNVLRRYVESAQSLGLRDNQWILRVCGDAPFPEPIYINHLALSIKEARGKFDVALCLGYPKGQQVEAFTVGCLKKALDLAEKNGWEDVKEHIDPMIDYTDPASAPIDLPYFNTLYIKPVDLSIDTRDDERRLNKIYGF